MALSIEDLKAYLAEHPQKYPLGKFESTLDSLFWEYLDGNYVSSDVIRTQIGQAEAQMSKLTRMEEDEVFNSFFVISGEWQRMAFIAGAQAGARLALELTNMCGDPPIR